MPLTRKQISILHVAKSKLGLEEEDYRAILNRIGGVASGRDLDAAGFEAVMKHFERLGFRSSKKPEIEAGFGYRPGMASPSQIRLVRALWAEFKAEETGDRQLGRWLEKPFHISAVRFLDYETASKVIGALKSMKNRKGQPGVKGALQKRLRKGNSDL